jgi:dihydroorotase
MIRFPRLVDCHVHFREPGLEWKGDLLSESIAAFFGGISVVCEMPNTNPPTQTIVALQDKILRAKRAEKYCDARFFFGATCAAHLTELESLWCNLDFAETKRRCSGLKLYLDNSTGDMKADDNVLSAAFNLCGKLGVTLVAHCEHAPTNNSCCSTIPYTGPAAHSLRRPPISEARSIAAAIDLARTHKTKLHIAHLSTAEGLRAVVDARAAGLSVTCEVTAHHLFLSTSSYDCCGAKVKVNPPVRDLSDRDALWEGVFNGDVNCFCTDHAPHTTAEKDDLVNPPSGIPSVELLLPLLLTATNGIWPHPTDPPPPSWSKYRLTHDHIIRMMHQQPNEIFSLGLSSELTTAVDLGCEWTVAEGKLHGKCGWSPYNGWKLTGKAIVSDS